MGTSAFGMGLLKGLGEGFKEGFIKIDDRIADRTSEASKYHQARMTREEKDFDDRQKEFEEGITLLQGFFGDDPNSWEKAGQVFAQYGGTLEGAKQAAGAGRLALAKLQKDTGPGVIHGVDQAVDFGSFFKFAKDSFDPESPKALEQMVEESIGEFTYTPNTTNNMKTSGLGKFLFGDVGSRINSQVQQDLQSRGINTGEAEPIERLLPSMYTRQGSKYLNLEKLAAIEQQEANVESTLTGIELTKAQANNYNEKTSLLKKEIGK